MKLLRHWLNDEGGQDLVEYALLGVTIAFAGLVTMAVFANVMNTVYLGWLTATDNLWYPDPPAN